MKKSVEIYKIGEVFFFMPTATMTGSYFRVIEPIYMSSNEPTRREINKLLRTAFENCIEADPTTLDDGAFKKFIQATGLRSHKKLIEKALYARATLKEGVLKVLRIGANKKYKAYMVDLGIPQVETVLEELTKPEALGKLVIDLFEQKIAENHA